MNKNSIIALLLIAPVLNTFAQTQPLKLWYEKPATRWEETLPLGNGRLGMMPDDGISKDHIVLNDITLWSGASQDANNYKAYKKLPEIRQLLLEGKNDEAQHIIDQSFVCKGPGSGNVPFGCFQTLGGMDLRFRYNNDNTEPQYEHYTRELSLDSAIARCSYQVDGTTYTREYFTSFGNDVDLIKLKADGPGKLNFTIALSRKENAALSTDKNTLIMSGRLPDGKDGHGMQYEARVNAVLKGGSLNTEDNKLVIKDATEVIIYLAAGTDWKYKDFSDWITRDLTAAKATPFAKEERTHIANYRKLFDRVSLNLGTTTSSSNTLPTDQRITAYRENEGRDNDFTTLFYQFGRYLSISSTRVGWLPPNLQGLWANEVHTPWNGDYHLDINVEMNHWPVEVSNLSELNLPLAELVKGMVSHGEKTAKAYYNAEGWVAHVITNIWGFTEPGESASWGVTKVGSGWLCDNLWQHYDFTNDKAYLRQIYPILKGAAQFYNSMLITEPKTGWLVTAPSSSPENTFYLPNGKTASICMGPTIDNQIIRELFNNVITAATILEKDKDLRDTLKASLQKLPPPGRIAADGRLMEWLEDYKETDVHHRHTSHLYGLYPASLITPESTPDLAEACKKTLNARGDDGPSWSIAYKVLWWARLHDGNRAYKLFREMLKPTFKTDINYGAGGGIYSNLLSAGPPFQIDGNFGATAGIAEMLLQSHAGFIDLLPAIPDTWKTSGEVKGLKARGNFTVDIKWKDGIVTDYRISSATARKVKVKVNGTIKTISSVAAGTEPEHH